MAATHSASRTTEHMVQQSSLGRHFKVVNTCFGPIVVLSDNSYRVVSDACWYGGYGYGAGAMWCERFVPASQKHAATPFKFKYVQCSDEYSSQFRRGTMVMLVENSGANSNSSPTTLPVMNQSHYSKLKLKSQGLLGTKYEYNRALVCPFFGDALGLDADTPEFPGHARVANIFLLRTHSSRDLEKR